jgi:hypothetical protein
MGREVGSSGTPHIQGYVEFKQQHRHNKVVKMLGGHAWFFPRLAPKSVDAANYCKEDGAYVERGRISMPGAASVIQDLCEQIEDGVTPDDLVVENPGAMHQYGRIVDRRYGIFLRRKWRTWMTQGIWYCGPTGTGKSHVAYEGFDPVTHYVFRNDHGWWDGYNGQKIVIFNDFRGSEIAYNILLQLVDKFPMYVSCRNKEPVPFLAETVIITSPYSPEELYGGKADHVDSLEQLIRRFTVVQMNVRFLQPVSERSGGNNETPETDEKSVVATAVPVPVKRASAPPPDYSKFAKVMKERELALALEASKWQSQAEANVRAHKLTLKDIVVDTPVYVRLGAKPIVGVDIPPLPILPF